MTFYQKTELVLRGLACPVSENLHNPEISNVSRIYDKTECNNRTCLFRIHVHIYDITMHDPWCLPFGRETTIISTGRVTTRKYVDSIEELQAPRMFLLTDISDLYLTVVFIDRRDALWKHAWKENITFVEFWTLNLFISYKIIVKWRKRKRNV